jgi:ribosome-associated heat shock protein Hsp15
MTMTHESAEAPARVRLDRWLWAARFFRSRGLASEAVAGGKVHCNGQRAKPAHGIKIGDQLQILRAEERFEVTVRALEVRRGSASTASGLYSETAESMAARERVREARRLAPAPEPGQRPDKQARRRLQALRRGT